MFVSSALISLALSLAATEARAEIPLGDGIEPALAVDVTPAGFDSLSDIVGQVIPPEIPVPPVVQSGERCEWSFLGRCVVWTYRYNVNISQIGVYPELDDLVVLPKTDALDISAGATVAVGSTARPIRLAATAEVLNILGIGGINVSQTCNAAITPFPVDLSADVYLDVVDDGGLRRLDATIPPEQVGWGWDLSGQNLQLWGCASGDVYSFLQWMGDLFGFDLLDLVLPYAEDAIDDLVDDLITDLEAQVEGMFAEASLRTTVDLMGAPLDIAIEPSDVQILPSGMRLITEATFDVPMHPCVAATGITGSRQTAGDLPDIGATVDGAPLPHHLGLFVSDETANAGLFAAWAGGALCQTLSESPGVPLNTSLLGLLTSEGFGDLFAERKPITLVTRPLAPPEATWTGTSDVNIAVRELGLDFYTELDGRQTRVVAASMDADAGVDLVFAETTGELLIDVQLDGSAIQVSVAPNDYAPGYEDEMASRFGGLFDSLVGPLIGSLLADLSFQLPAFEGFGLTALHLDVAGASSDFLGGFATTGPVTYAAGGCDDPGGGCDGGCDGGVGSSRLAFLALPATLAVLRRRRQA